MEFQAKGLPSAELDREAERLAAQPYSVVVERQMLSSNASLFVAYHPDLEGCLAQGMTDEEALVELAEVRRKYIRHYLEQGLPVPMPKDHGVQIVFLPTERAWVVDVIERGQAETLLSELKQRAEDLAVQPYQVVLDQDEATDGNPIVIAWHPEFSVQTERSQIRGCLSQGMSEREALANLADARREFILGLLEDGCPVPELAAPIQIVALYGVDNDSSQRTAKENG